MICAKEMPQVLRIERHSCKHTIACPPWRNLDAFRPKFLEFNTNTKHIRQLLLLWLSNKVFYFSFEYLDLMCLYGRMYKYLYNGHSENIGAFSKKEQFKSPTVRNTRDHKG